MVAPRRRRNARLVAVAAFFASSLMLGAAAFQTQLARRQVELDQVDRQIRAARNDFNDLRSQRAELRSPERLADQRRGTRHDDGSQDRVPRHLA